MRKNPAGVSADIIVLCAKIEEVQKIYRTIVEEVSKSKRVLADRAARNEVPNSSLSEDNELSQAWLRIPSADGATAAKVVFGACGNMGNVSSAARTAYYSALHTPSLIIFAGIAGSLDPSKMRLGDVMVPRKIDVLYFDKIEELTMEKRTEFLEKEDIPEVIIHAGWCKLRPKRPQLDFDSRDAVELFKQLQPRSISERLETLELPSTFRDHGIYLDRAAKFVKEDTIFSWEKVFNSLKFRDYAVRFNHMDQQSVAVDMESFGFASVVNSLKELDGAPCGIVVRSISDYVGFKHITDKDERHDWRDLALKNAALTVLWIIQNAYPKVFDVSGASQ